MKRSVGLNVTILFLGLVPTVSACAIKDIAGAVDAAVATGGALGSGGSDAITSTGGAAEISTGGSDATASTGGATEVTTGGTYGYRGQVTSGGALATGGVVATGGSTATLPTWATADDCVTNEENAQFVGTWEGYIQGTPIGDEASSIRLTVVGANSTGLCGTVKFGTHTTVTLPVATNPKEVYPPESIIPWTCRSRPTGKADRILGFTYTIQNGMIDAQRATITIAYTEVYQSWCSLQTPYPGNSTPTGYDCLPSLANRTVTSNDCDKALQVCPQECLCTGYGPICACAPQGCTAEPRSAQMLFDLLFNGNQAMGILGDPGINMHNASNVVFNRVSTCEVSGSTCHFDADCCSKICAMNTDAGAATCQ